MRINRRVTFLAAGVLFALLLTSCTAHQGNTQSTDAPSQTETAPLTEAAVRGSVYRAAYATQLAELRSEFSAELPQGEYEGQTGVLFADLMDWDSDGTPELVVLSHDSLNDQDKFRLDVYGEEDGKSVSLLQEFVGSSYGFLSSDLDFYITKNDADEIVVRVDDSGEFQSLKESYYTLSAGEVRSTVLSAQSSIGGWADGDPVEPDAYQIDGQSCSKVDFKAHRQALGGENALSVYCQRIYDLQALDAFLTGQSETYSGGALAQANELLDQQIPWAKDIIFKAGV